MANKTDVKRIDELSEEAQSAFKQFEEENIPILSMSTLTEEGVMNVKTEVSKVLKVTQHAA